MAELPKAAQGTFDELLAGVEPDRTAIARRLRRCWRTLNGCWKAPARGPRHVKIRSLAEANCPPVRALVAAALARRRSGATGPARPSTPRPSSEQGLPGLCRSWLDL